MSIRILHCIHSLSGGGAEKQLSLLVNASSNIGIASGIFCVNDSGNNITDCSVKIYKSLCSNKFNLSIFSSLNKTINDFKPDIIHVWLPEAVTIPAQLMAFIRRIPCVYSYRNRMHFHRPLSIFDFLCTVGISKRIVSNNPINQSSFPYRWLYLLKNGTEIANSVHVDPRYARDRQINIAGNRIKLLFVGRITHQKNWQCILKALPFIDSRHDWELIICGDGDQKEMLERSVDEMNLKDKVKLLGYCSNVYQIMQSSDLMILPSWYEGMPNVFLESLAIGLPCIVSDIPAHNYIINSYNCAVKFDPTSPNELAHAINQLIDNDNKVLEMIRAGKNAAKDYTPEFMADAYYKLYLNILKA